MAKRGTFEVIDQGQNIVLRLEEDGEDAKPIFVFVEGDTAYVTANGKTSGPLVSQGQTGQSAQAALLEAVR